MGYKKWVYPYQGMMSLLFAVDYIAGNFAGTKLSTISSGQLFATGLKYYGKIKVAISLFSRIGDNPRSIEIFVPR